MTEEIQYCYLVEHPEYGTRVFYNAYDAEKAAKLAVDYAENLCIVFKTQLSTCEEKRDYSLSSLALRKPIDLPTIPVDGLLLTNA